MKTAVSQWLARLWLPDGDALDLAMARILVGLHALWILTSRDLAALSELPAPFWVGVTPDSRWRYLVFEDRPGLERALTAATILLLTSVVAGLWVRVTALSSALLLYHLAPLEALFVSPNPCGRGLTIDVLALVVLSGSRAGDAIRPFRARSGSSAEAWEYGWPLQLIRLFYAQIYLFAGVARIRTSGLSWITSDNIRYHLLIPGQLDPQMPLVNWGSALAESAGLCLLLAASSFVFDLVFVLAVFSRAWRFWLVPFALVFHVSLLLMLNIFFLNLPQLLLFVDWHRVAARLTVIRRAWPIT